MPLSILDVLEGAWGKEVREKVWFLTVNGKVIHLGDGALTSPPACVVLFASFFFHKP